MKKIPLSVVMAVKNGGEYLTATIESVLKQTFEDFEFIIIDDGSYDQTADTLNDFAGRDSRIKLYKSSARGLTKALVLGCGKSSGEYIARQDAGDLSLPSRFEDQLGFFRTDSDFVAVHSTVQTISPEGISLYQNKIDERQLASSLSSSDVENLEAPPHHGAAMMRSESYFKAGGYRPEFYFAQDLDLWVRMARLGKHGVLDKSLYKSRLSADSISGQYGDYQDRLKVIIAKMNLHPEDKNRQAQLLKQADAIRPQKRRPANNLRKSRANYFIGSCLLRANHHELARKYFWQSLTSNPLQLKALFKLLFKVN